MKNEKFCDHRAFYPLWQIDCEITDKGEMLYSDGFLDFDGFIKADAPNLHCPSSTHWKNGSNGRICTHNAQIKIRMFCDLFVMDCDLKKSKQDNMI